MGRQRHKSVRRGMMDRAVLVLNALFEPIRITAARRAMTLISKGAAVTLVAHDVEAYPGIFLPSVVRLTIYRRVPHIAVLPQRRNVCLRDGYCCQYCGNKFPSSELTLDHVLPRAQGGPSTWENLVACCGPCNRRKSNRTPEQAGMPLLRKPKARTVHTSKAMIRIMGQDDPKWREYLYF